MEPEEQPPLLERFVNGFGRSAVNGALMMGIYYSLMFATKALGIFTMLGMSAPVITLGGAMGSALLVTAAVAIFGGVIATGIFAAKHIHHQHTPAPRNEPEMQEPNLELAPALEAPAMGATPLPILADEAATHNAMPAITQESAAPPTRWTQRANIAAPGSRDRIQQILAEGTPESRAAAILAEQNATGATPTIH